MKIICISGYAQSGKDTTGKLIKRHLEEQGNKVLITHYADLLKYICKMFFGWNGEKDIYGRTLLQQVGQIVREKTDGNYWVDSLISIIKLFLDEWEYVIIPDVRYENEISKLKDEFDVTTVRIERPNFDNGMTDEQKNHESETALDNYIFDYKIINNGDESIHNEVNNFIEWLKVGD